MGTPYPVRPEQWADTPILRGINPLTQLIEGDDSGYRSMRTLPSNPSPLVVPAVTIRANYDGVSEYGAQQAEIALAGGLRDGVLVVRECVARELEEADKLLKTVFGGELRLCAVDGFRSWRRQAAGFTRMLLRHLGRLGLSPVNVDNDVLTFLDAGNRADGTFSWVNAQVSSAAYAALVEELRRDSRMIEQLRAYAATQAKGGPVTNEMLDEALYTYVTVSANSGLGRAANRCPLNFEGNAHAGGGAVDLLLLDGQGRPVNVVPFDYPGDEAGMDFMEDDAHYDVLIARASEESDAGTMLRTHLSALGYPTPAAFSRRDWKYFRDVNRVRFHLGKARGWTYYSSAHGGENWHFEPGNKGYDPLSGEVTTFELLTAEQLPDAGNPGHTLQKLGREATAVWGGSSGHEQARSFGLEE